MVQLIFILTNLHFIWFRLFYKYRSS